MSPNGIGSSSVGFFQEGETAIFSFASAITAFAIAINAFGTSNGAYMATLDTGDTVDSIFEVFPGEATGQFLGFVSSIAFNTLTLTNVKSVADPNETYMLDTLIYGDAAAVAPGVVPLSAAGWLMLAGLCGLFAAGRRKAT